MLKPGRYKSEHDGDVFHAYRYVMEVKETSKSYVFKLLEVENLYADDHIEIMFGGKKRIVLPKDKPCRHAMRVWSDHDPSMFMSWWSWGGYVPLLWMSRPIRVLQARVNMDICSESIGRATVNPAECLLPRWNV